MENLCRLNWGCGAHSARGWINVDCQKRPGVDICCDIVRDGLPLRPDGVDYIASQHALQELSPHDVEIALRELRRVLRPGGRLRLGLVDLDRLISAYQQRRAEHFWCAGWGSIGGAFARQIVEDGCLRTPMNFEFAQELLQDAGFVEVKKADYRQTHGADPALAALDRRPEESLYVEAIKVAPTRKPASLESLPSQIHLSWTGDPATSLTVTWQTTLDEKLLASYRKAGDSTWSEVAARAVPPLGRGFLHRAEMTGLRPDTAYEYCVSHERGDTHRTRTLPAPGAAGGDVSFAFLCDTGLIGRPDGKTDGTKRVLDEIIAANPHFILGGGDYAYADRDGRFEDVTDAIDAWFEQMQPALSRIPLMAQFGNHEIALTERCRDWGPRFAHPPGFHDGRNYSFSAGDAHIAALYAPEPNLSVEQLLWLDNDLAQARRRGTRWLIVFQHEPLFAHGRSHPADPRMRRWLAPILERHRVDLHLSGHDQNYERTYPLLNVADGIRVTSTSRDRYEAGIGVIYAKISPGGKRSDIRNDFSRFTMPQQPFMAMRDDTAHHYALLNLRRSAGELEVSVYRVPRGGAPGSLLETFRIAASRG